MYGPGYIFNQLRLKRLTHPSHAGRSRTKDAFSTFANIPETTTRVQRTQNTHPLLFSSLSVSKHATVTVYDRPSLKGAQSNRRSGFQGPGYSCYFFGTHQPDTWRSTQPLGPSKSELYFLLRFWDHPSSCWRRYLSIKSFLHSCLSHVSYFLFLSLSPLYLSFAPLLQWQVTRRLRRLTTRWRTSGWSYLNRRFREQRSTKWALAATRGWSWTPPTKWKLLLAG